MISTIHKSCLFYGNSEAREVRALYSASADDLATVGYFFDFHEIRASPKKTQNSVVDLRVTLQLPQSASVKAVVMRKEDLTGKSNPLPWVPLRYFMTRYTLVKWVVQGYCMN